MSNDNALRKTSLAGFDARFRAGIEPHLTDLRRIARHELDYHVAVGDIGQGSLDPDDIIADVLIRAWEERADKPAALDMRAWLVSLLYRAIDAALSEEKAWDEIAPVSLDSSPAEGNAVWDVDETLADQIPDELNDPERIMAAIEQRAGRLRRTARRSVLMHDGYRVSLHAVAQITGQSPGQTAHEVWSARAVLAA